MMKNLRKWKESGERSGTDVVGTAPLAPIELKVAIDVGADALFVLGVVACLAHGGTARLGQLRRRVAASRLAPHAINRVRVLVSIRIEERNPVPGEAIQDAAVALAVLRQFVEHPRYGCCRDPLVCVHSFTTLSTQSSIISIT